MIIRARHHHHLRPVRFSVGLYLKGSVLILVKSSDRSVPWREEGNALLLFYSSQRLKMPRRIVKSDLLNVVVGKVILLKDSDANVFLKIYICLKGENYY